MLISLERQQAALEHFLGPQSPLARGVPGFDRRPGQLAMANEVAFCLNRQIPLVAEAGTGTGKTLAYLLPALLSGLKVIISTGTKTLQDQISHKELPLVRQALNPELTWAVLKGRSNYLCYRRFLILRQQPELALTHRPEVFTRLRKWLKRTADGDLDQIRGELLNDSLAAELTSNSEQCLGSRCPEREHCFLMEARRRAGEAQMVVVNHHLFLADLLLKIQGQGEALPRYQAVIFDEAHMLPDAATQIFGINLSNHRLNLLLRDVRMETPAHRLEGVLGTCRLAVETFFAALSSLLGASASMSLGPEHLARLEPEAQTLMGALQQLSAGLNHDPAEEVLAGRAAGMEQELVALFNPVAGASLAWAQSRGSLISFHLSPVEVGPHLEDALYQDISALVFTSATLAPLDDLTPFCQRLGLPAETRQIVVASPFDLASQALLYVPSHMPEPSHNNFVQAVTQEVEKLLTLSQGRAFVLFTSHRNLEAVARHLAPRLKFSCLVQGQAPRLELLQRFVEESPCVLFATAGFWQGVDVPGPALSAVIVDKLPFAPPDEPLVAARCRLLETRGKSGFANLLLPEAILSLKQGLGRLLRTSSDRGLMAVLDARLCSKPYGRLFLKALAPIPLTRDLAQVEEFFKT